MYLRIHSISPQVYIGVPKCLNFKPIYVIGLYRDGIKKIIAFLRL